MHHIDTVQDHTYISMHTVVEKLESPGTCSYKIEDCWKWIVCMEEADVER
jgi:hypothetical protein